MQTAIDRLKVIANKLGNLLVVAAAMVSGFLIGYYYWYMMAKANHPKMTKTLRTVSVAVNERDELMIIDRSTGTYSVYQDSVGLMIFNTYATKRYNLIVK